MIYALVIALWLGVLVNTLKLFLVSKKTYVIPEGVEDPEGKQASYDTGRRFFASLGHTFWGVVMAFAAILLTQAYS